MAYRTEKMCISFLFILLGTFGMCEPKTTTIQHIYDVYEPVDPINAIVNTLKNINDTLNILKKNSINSATMEKNVYDTLNIIKENSNASAKIQEKVYDALNIIKENSITAAKVLNNICPDRYERLIKGCFYLREKGPAGNIMSWISARLYCQAIDGDLAVVDDIPKFLNYYENQPNFRLQEYHWYGASRIGHEILYVNGTVLPASSSLWEAGYPGPGNCVALHTSKQKLITTDCAKKYYFICKADW
ncbi:unnamed protein product [Meganyctiphanes norvegica]|uniref:C-type lectin domain-containing protein n=1 Tax=Meganyctiphanes norvegica TaxID=48144 RepID=A0AAV2Q8Y0_MEGNR